MATSLMSGLIASGYAPRQIWVSDTNQATLQSHADHLKVNISASNEAVAEEVDVVVLAVKPQIMRDIAMQIAPVIRKQHTLIVSIAAGISQGSLSFMVGTGCSHRSMHA